VGNTVRFSEEKQYCIEMGFLPSLRVRDSQMGLMGRNIIADLIENCRSVVDLNNVYLNKGTNTKMQVTVTKS
jgi:hypothetical protein